MTEYIKCETCLYNKNCQFLAKHRNTIVEDCSAYKNAADVVEVVRGEWIEKGYEGIMTYCSECLHRAPFNNHQELILSNYCPNCGADMRKIEKR